MEKKESFVVKKHWFIDSKQGNIKEEFRFLKKLGSGGYGTVYLAERRKTGKQISFLSFPHLYFCVNLFSEERFAVKAIQKTKIKDYENFLNEMEILKSLVPTILIFRTIPTSSSFTKPGKLPEFAFLSLSMSISIFLHSFVLWKIYLCVRLCEGGELFFYITKRKFLTEEDAAMIMR
jgi:serine/threonine protein kinase